MGVISVSSSAAQPPLGLNTQFSTSRLTAKRPLIVAFKADKSNNTALVAPPDQIPLPIETLKEKKRLGKTNKPSNRVKALSTEVSPCNLEVDYNEAAAKLENIYKLSPATEASEVEHVNGVIRRGRQGKRKTSGGEEEAESRTTKTIVKNRAKKAKRLSLDKRIALRKNKEEKVVTSIKKKKDHKDENVKIDELVREYSASTDLISLDWKKMKIPPVLPSTEHAWLFKLMQPMKELLQVKEYLQKNLGREPAEGELADATNMDVLQVRKHMEVGRAARNKLIKVKIYFPLMALAFNPSQSTAEGTAAATANNILNDLHVFVASEDFCSLSFPGEKHNLRLILFVINKYFQDFANGPKFQDLCQAGVKGLITAVDRFEPKRRSQLSTYGLFWIRHAIIRSMTLSSFTRVSFGLESIRVEIQKAKLEQLFELQRQPTEEEIIQKVGISPERYHEVMRASKPVSSLHARHAITQEELINGITDVDGGDNRQQPALLRLALDDVLDSLKPKESLVIRQRYGLDGKGDRTLGEIAGNLNISREMVRKHEVKALMKLKHPARVDYLRRYVT